MKYKVAVVGGGGHIGLPLSCYIQYKNVETLIIDKNKEVLSKISNSTTPFKELNLDKSLIEAIEKGLKVSDKIEEVKSCNVIIVCLGTSSKKQDKDLFNDVIEDIFTNIGSNSLIILRSTIEKGLSESITEKYNLIEKNNLLAYCPERIAEGFALEEIEKLPQIVGTKNEDEFVFFKKFFDEIDINTLNTNYSEAEFLKLFLNTYRYAQFSLINYFANISNTQSINFHQLLNIGKKEYPRLDGVPEPGLIGGPCLIKDSKTFVSSYDQNSEFMNQIFQLNENYIQNIIDEINTKFTDKKIIQLGITFKPNSDDLRDSQSMVLHKRLLDLNYSIEIVDPNIPETKSYDQVESFSKNVLISTFHDEFKHIDFSNKEVIIVGKK